MENVIKAGNCTGIYERINSSYVIYWDMGCPETTMDEKRTVNRCQVPSDRWDEYLLTIKGMKSYGNMVDETVAFSKGATHKLCSDGVGKTIKVPLFEDPQEIDVTHRLVYIYWVYMKGEVVVHLPY